jgi:hypothetical protein
VKYALSPIPGAIAIGYRASAPIRTLPTALTVISYQLSVVSPPKCARSLSVTDN